MNTFWYTFKIWQTSVIVSPLCFTLFVTIINWNIEFFPGMFFLLVISGTIFSFPSFLIFWLTTYLTTLVSFTPARQRLIFSATGIVLTALPYMLLGSFFPRDETLIWFILPYAGVIVAGVYYYKKDLDINNHHSAH
ncbi:MAG: hypothetical protein EOP54_29300 [Sphingobacteriales bacterium]|nr:MAG: hypothetical protein EOP54_29300 [Sphingobacteriales bacterium]